MPLSSLRGTLFTRASEAFGETSTSLDIDGLSDIGEALADADLFIIDNGGAGTNTKTAVSRIPTYVFSGISGAISINSSGVASLASDASGTNLTLSGDLTVNGSTVSINTSTVTVDDPMFALADNNSADTVDIGWYGKYVDSGTKYSGLFRDASDSDMWKLFATTGNSNAAPSTTVDTTSGFTLANLSVNGLTATTLTGSLAASNLTDIDSLSEISSVANDDVFIAIDTSGGGLKKITRSEIVSGLATSGAISNVSEDSTPQLGGDLDVNSNDIVSTSNGNISLLPNGSGKVVMDGNGSSGGISISDGTIDIRTGTGSVAKVLFYCESSNAHAQTVQAQPHSAGVTNTLTLPAGGNGELVSTVATQTLTNKSLGSDLDIFEDANNADVKLTMGTSAAESLTIQVLNGSSNKTAEEVHFSTATASGTADHGKMVFDIDGSDIAEIDDDGINIASGKTFRINGSAIAGTDTTYTAGDLLDLDGTEFDVDLTEAGEAAIANGDYILFLDGGATGTHAKEAIADVATLFAGTGLTATNSVIAVDSSQAITALTGGDLTIYEDANNADVSLKLGTSATESLSIEVLNGSSNKTAEEIHFSTATASSTANHGKMVFDIDGTDQMEINDSGVSITGDLTITGDDLFMNTNTAGHILVGDDTNYNPVAVSGDVTLSSSGAVTIANDAVESGMLNDNVISGQTEISSGLADADELLYSDGGTLKKVGLDTLTTHINSTAASKGFATAMAIAL